MLRVGGADTEQLFVQDRLALRDDLSRFVQWKGNHSVKAGIVLSRMKYDVTKFFTANPVFRYRSDGELRLPVRGPVRDGRSDAQRRQHAARALPPGRLERDASG